MTNFTAAKCLNCVFFSVYTDWQGATVHECRRLPPVRDSHPLARYSETGVHPRVRKDHWCGEFKDATQTTPRQPQGRNLTLD